MRYKDHINIKFYLIRWKYYQEQRYYLEDLEKENATALFNALNGISVEDRELLSEKYYKSTIKADFDFKKEVYRTVKPIKNSELCLKRNLSEERYTQKMRLAEHNLKNRMFEIYNQMYEKLEEFKLMIGKSLYFKGYLNESKTGLNEYLLSQSMDEGMIFVEDINNREYYDLIALGFRKVPIK
ncbi:hypothetical protein ACFFIF_08035 [Vagococcus entomophilus]|uniref:Uncharacterized protein n=1 Tax=Vagococcus entomophilus TaxID=1160095 RepID=A0A430AHB8_9ENTE|nr:hypothetical protein [Vagococcus entomophilus]RSU07288.1 hypothetical protein CBF30_08530 [Vagococcus entomophilus]